ncbi:VOC family protein [Halobacillus salinarum]|uniref:VOC family protein n=1 Tax=Halobacillus salinarum TaxID=2932257 RepID=A0ABY4EJI5_9BACI|nr:VOC family protein [Halobacillus salinarum]UOQ44233.1 VOC family protein [Halobacillus salinarum]
MIQKLGQVMLYVENQDEAVDFWTDIMGFMVIADENDGQGMRWIEVAPSKEAETSLVLHNKELIAKMQPELNLGTPSLMFYSEDLQPLHHNLVRREITVGEIVNMPSGKVFNFADYENNYFAVMEKNEDVNS